MKDFPLTFAVFFQSIIYPNMSINKNMSKDALFAGAFEIDKSNPNYIAPGTYSDYIKGKRPIRTLSVNNICSMSPEELVPRIQLLGLQDMSSVLKSVKNVLEILDISSQLREELLCEINELKNAELLLAKIFQLSMKCSNKKKFLCNEELLFLNRVGEKGITSNVKKEISDTEDRREERSSQKKSEFTSESLYNKIENLLHDYSGVENKMFIGTKTIWQDVILPEDFDAFITYIATIVDMPTTFNLDFLDIISACGLDLKRGICREGNLKILDFSCFNEHIFKLKKVLNEVVLEECQSCVLIICGDYGLVEANEIACIVGEKADKCKEFLFSVCYDESITDYVNIKVIFTRKD